MEGFFVGLFIFINLCIRLPIRIMMRFKKNNKTLENIDLWTTIITFFFMGAIMIYAYCIDEISLGMFAILALLFLGFPSCLSYLSMKKSKEDREYWNKLYLQTRQNPEGEDYGLSCENPIWAGTASYYFEHIRTADGHNVTWKRTGKIRLEKDGGFEVLNGFSACELGEYDVFVNGTLINTFYICTKSGLDKMPIWHAPKGYKFLD